MKNKKIIRLALISATISMMMSSCATIVSGGSPSITIDGDVKGPVTIKTEKQTYSNVTLPCVVKVKRHRLDGQRISIQSENKHYRDIVLEKSTNAWAFGNILLGGIIGWCIDMGTNAVSVPAQKRFYVRRNDVLE